jgi:hypothetical protein
MDAIELDDTLVGSRAKGSEDEEHLEIIMCRLPEKAKTKK